MKIAWFTPFSKKSAIGRCSRGIVEALAKFSQVDVMCFDTDEIHSTDVRVRTFTASANVTDAILAEYEIVVYNFGNYLPFHRGIYEVSLRCRGIAILHDFVMHHFFAGYYLDHLKVPREYERALERLYGEAGRSTAGLSLSPSGPRIWETDQVADFPMFEGVIGNAEGVVTHSDFFRKRVEEVFGGPIQKLSLPYTVETEGSMVSRAELDLGPHQLVILTIGHVNANKRIVDTIEALAHLRSRGIAFQYVVAGRCAPGYLKDVQRAIHDHRLQGAVRIAGEVSDDVMRSYLSHADICVNLRFPATEGASASAIEEMLFCKPLIVGNVGFYGELPDDCVVKINPHSVAELTAALMRLASQPAERSRLAQRAQEFARKEFRPESYAVGLSEFMVEVRRARPLLELADHTAKECSNMGITRDMPLVATLADELGALFSFRDTNGD